MRSVLLALLLLAFTASSAAAEGTLTVNGTEIGSVNGDGIACTISNGPDTGDCSEFYADDEICTGPNDGPPCRQITAQFSVTASPASGWAFERWSGTSDVCANSTNATCSGPIATNRTARPVFVNVASPRVSFAAPAAGDEVNASKFFSIGVVDDDGAVATSWVIKQDGFADVVFDFAGPPVYSRNFPATLQSRPNTPFTVVARARDAAGNVGEATRSFVLDRDTGGMFFGASPEEGETVTDDPVTIEFVHDPDVPSANVSCRVGAAAFVPCSSPYRATLPDGVHTMQLRLEDDAENVATLNLTFKVDRTAPELSVTSPTGTIGATTITPTVSATDAGGSTPTLTCALDDGAYGVCADIAVSEGAHVLHVRATDNVGNARTVDASFTVDRTLPELAVTPVATGSVVEVQWTATDASSLTFACKLDAGEFTACASGIQYSGVAPGEHTVTVRATDAAGNSRSQTRTFVVSTSGGGSTGGGSTGGGSTGGGSTGGGSTGGGSSTLPTRPKITAPSRLALKKAKRKLRVTLATTVNGCRFRLLKGKRTYLSRSITKAGTTTRTLALSKRLKPGAYVLALTCGRTTVKRRLRITR